MIDEKKLEQLKNDVKTAKEQPMSEELLTEVFNRHKEFISSLSAEEALFVENELGFWKIQITTG